MEDDLEEGEVLDSDNEDGEIKVSRSGTMLPTSVSASNHWVKL